MIEPQPTPQEPVPSDMPEPIPSDPFGDPGSPQPQPFPGQPPQGPDVGEPVPSDPAEPGFSVQ